MARQLKPGLAFSIVCGSRFAVGLMTNHKPKIGHLVWIAEDTFDEVPTLDETSRIARWRWPVFFPLSSALHRGLVTSIGSMPIPPALQGWPAMRGGNRQSGWRMVYFDRDQQFPPPEATDRKLPIYQVVDDTALKEMIVSDWRPEKIW